MICLIWAIASLLLLRGGEGKQWGGFGWVWGETHKGNESQIRRTDAETEAPILWPPDVKNQLIGKDPDAGKDWRQEEKGMTEDETVGWHHRLNEHEFEQALGVGDGQGSLLCYSPWGHKESGTTEQLNWTELGRDRGGRRVLWCLSSFYLAGRGESLVRDSAPSSSYWQNMTHSQWSFLLSLLGTTSPGYHWDLVPLGASRKSQNMDLGQPVVGAESRAQCSWGQRASKKRPGERKNVGVPRLRNVADSGAKMRL